VASYPSRRQAGDRGCDVVAVRPQVPCPVWAMLVIVHDVLLEHRLEVPRPVIAYMRRRVTAQSTWKKSHASIVAAWVRRNCRQVVRLRWGAGGIRSRLRTRRTVEAPTRYPRPSSSPSLQVNEYFLAAACSVGHLPLVAAGTRRDTTHSPGRPPRWHRSGPGHEPTCQLSRHARWPGRPGAGSRMVRTSRSHVAHDHKHHDHDATGHARQTHHHN
jgi:hypothetical protein